ncbi:hypothetical protein AB0C61_05120 [Streptomyces sp. NPDC048680]|uniref:hypothetical protein n=1 Tax=Streptomyces sp. NPDC048680 TaxID=3155492 RepID=UPI00342EB273
MDVVARNKGLLAALGHAATTAQRSPEDARGTQPLYEFWHGHITALISQERPDLDAELLAHMLLATLSSVPILRLLEQGDGRRPADSLRAQATALPNTSASTTDRGTNTSPPPGP